MNSFKDKIFKNSFTAYLRGVFASPVITKGNRGLMVETFINTISFVFVATTFASWGALFYLTWLVIGVYRRAKPSPLGLLPISWRRRTVYSLLSNLVYTLFIALCIVVGILVWMFIVGLIVLCFTGQWIFSFIPEALPIPEISVYGSLMIFFVGLLVYGCGLLFTYINKKSYRLAAILGFGLFAGIIRFVITLIYTRDGSFGSWLEIDSLLQISELGWLYVTLVGLIGVTVLGFGIYKCIKTEMPAKY